MVKWWLLSGVILIFIQVFIGGVTRLTGSGLSITKWEIVVGTFPPTNDIAWFKEFDRYKETPQYRKLNHGMSIDEFKFIYFWEYFHRLWARIMGLIFMIPFLYILFKGSYPTWFIRRLGIILLWAALVAAFGWIMVASGLRDRPWVNAYNLSLHLCLAMGLMGYILWTYLKYIGQTIINVTKRLKRLILVFFVLICCQVFLGGIVSGMHAALSYPSWPTMNGQIIPVELSEIKNWNFGNFLNYDQHSFMAAFVQFFHRLTAYSLLLLGIFLNIRIVHERKRLPLVVVFLNAFLVIQVLLGIGVLLYSAGTIPLWLGVLHQSVGMLVFLSCLIIVYLTEAKP